MIQHDNILIVPVPKNFISAKWETGNEGKILWINSEFGMKGKRLQLPHGHWRILGRAKELETATGSGFSLLRSHGIDPENNPLILVKEKEGV